MKHQGYCEICKKRRMVYNVLIEQSMETEACERCYKEEIAAGIIEIERF